MFLRSQRIGIALGGGGARGLAHLGVLEVLEQAGIHPAAVSGTSAGSILGALYGLYGYEGSRQVIQEGLQSPGYREIGFGGLKQEHHGLFGTVQQWVRNGLTYLKALRNTAVLSGRALEVSIKNLVRYHTFDDLPWPFYVSALDLTRGMDVIFTTGPLWRALYASSAIPGVFPPLPLNDWQLVDGGPSMKVPVEALWLHGVDFVIAVDVGSPMEERHSLGNALETMIRADELGVQKLHRFLLHLAHVVIRPNLADMTWVDFDRWEFAVDQGREAAERALPEIRRALRENHWIRRWLRRRLLHHLHLEENKVYV